ncbi:S-adenosylmethionine-dependent methyltransferase [Sporobolomyces salmoneus]|uniref:S-adenosylmethionine-dependent methyltransferase n=1 Tax=Sporobolomyces salmoneus TaxID=183962 RepID=UPI0031824458
MGVRSLPPLIRPYTTSSGTVSILKQKLSSHYHSLDPDLPLRVHEQVAAQELTWLEQHARSQGYGSGNWQTKLSHLVDSIIKDHKPLAYILGELDNFTLRVRAETDGEKREVGSQPFHPLPVDLLVRPPILVPRPETEHWVLHLSQTILSSVDFTASSTSSDSPTTQRKFRILDIGTGSGCIALGLSQSLLPSQETPTETRTGLRLETIAIDQSPLAVELARENAERCSLGETVSVHQMDLFSEDFVTSVKRLGGGGGGAEGEGEAFDLVVSNPPYITKKEYEGLDLSVKNWEDRKALVGELPFSSPGGGEAEKGAGEGRDDGLIFYRKITSILDDLLANKDQKQGRGGGQHRPPNVAFEVGKGQAQEVGKMLRSRGYKAEIVSDPWGVERAVFGWKP